MLKGESEVGVTLFHPFICLWLLPSNRIKVIIRKVEDKEFKCVKCVSFADDLTCFLHPKKNSDVTHFLIAHIPMMNAQDLSLTRTKKKPIGLMGTQFLLQ